MKRKLLFLFLFTFLLGGVQTVLSIPVELHVGRIDPTPGMPGLGKDPIQIPNVWIDDHTLTFEPIHESFTLYVVDSSNNPVHFDLVPINTQTVVLPSTLTGTYKLLLIADTHFFYGFINL